MLEESIAEWRSHLSRRQAIHSVDADELEDHLRSQIKALQEAGLDEDEAFLIAVKRIGDLDAVAREFAREYSERLWKRLVLAPGTEAAGGPGNKEAVVALGLSVAAAVAIKLPELFGVSLKGSAADTSFYATGAMADRSPARVCGVGMDRGRGLSADLRVPVGRPSGLTRGAACAGRTATPRAPAPCRPT